jgi:hypothetical protein
MTDVRGKQFSYWNPIRKSLENHTNQFWRTSLTHPMQHSQALLVVQLHVLPHAADMRVSHIYLLICGASNLEPVATTMHTKMMYQRLVYSPIYKRK